MQWKHKSLKTGAISFAPRHRTLIVNGLFEAPDDQALAARLQLAGHIPIHPPEEEEKNGTSDADAERKTKKHKKASGG